MSTSKCVLAFSGGLDTSAIVPWLIDQGYEVHAVVVDVGQHEDLDAARNKALRLGSETAVVRDGKAGMFAEVLPLAIGLAATYEGTYRLGTALARPFIALEQVRRADELGGATLVHGATGKGNDQIRFEFAYASLAAGYPVLAPWKTWEFAGRQDLVDYLKGKGIDGDYESTKEFSLDENLWHLSVEGGALEDPDAEVDVQKILAAVAGHFSSRQEMETPPDSLQIRFECGVPVGLCGQAVELPTLIARLNDDYRHASWAWDLVIENRFTGIKSRGLYINPAAKLLHLAVEALARSCLNKPSYDQYVALGRQYGAMLYRGEFFSDQRLMLEGAARAAMAHLNGEITVSLKPTPYVSRINSGNSIFCAEQATFEASDFSHQDAQGFIQLSWLSSIGRRHTEGGHANALETKPGSASTVRENQSLFRGRLVPTSV